MSNTFGTILNALVVSVAVVTVPAHGQTPGRVATVGILMATVDSSDPLIDRIREALSDLGYTKGKNIRYEYRSARGQVDRLPSLAEELVRANVDVIITGPESAVAAAKRATTTTPIVMVALNADPVAAGLIASFAKPGGNVTGIYIRQPEVLAKRLEILRETIPRLSRVAVFYDAVGAKNLPELSSAAGLLGVRLVPIELKAPYNLPAAFKAAHAEKVDALLTLYAVPFYVERARIAPVGY